MPMLGEKRAAAGGGWPAASELARRAAFTRERTAQLIFMDAGIGFRAVVLAQR